MTEKQEKSSPAYKISIAPMLDWTDRHFRYFLRLICRRPLFYTEMIAAPALILGNRAQLLAYSPEEHPLALQVGGSDPQMMAQCAVYAQEEGYLEVNMNAGCPSTRVQAGAFGAVLMKTPEIVADCVDAMRARVSIPVTVKTRISLADSPLGAFESLFRFADLVKQAGCDRLIVHARQVRLNWSPKDNRGDRLPLQYDLVYRLKKSFPDMPIVINGNIQSIADIDAHLTHVDGVMIGRKAYGTPYEMARLDALYYGDDRPIPSREDVLEAMLPYLDANQNRLSVICPHLMGLYHGQPHAKAYKQVLMRKDLSELAAFLKRRRAEEAGSDVTF